MPAIVAAIPMQSAGENVRSGSKADVVALCRFGQPAGSALGFGLARHPGRGGVREMAQALNGTVRLVCWAIDDGEGG